MDARSVGYSGDSTECRSDNDFRSAHKKSAAGEIQPPKDADDEGLEEEDDENSDEESSQAPSENEIKEKTEDEDTIPGNDVEWSVICETPVPIPTVMDEDVCSDVLEKDASVHDFQATQEREEVKTFCGTQISDGEYPAHIPEAVQGDRLLNTISAGGDAQALDTSADNRDSPVLVNPCVPRVPSAHLSGEYHEAEWATSVNEDSCRELDKMNERNAISDITTEETAVNEAERSTPQGTSDCSEAFFCMAQHSISHDDQAQYLDCVQRITDESQTCQNERITNADKITDSSSAENTKMTDVNPLCHTTPSAQLRGGRCEAKWVNSDVERKRKGSSGNSEDTAVKRTMQDTPEHLVSCDLHSGHLTANDDTKPSTECSLKEAPAQQTVQGSLLGSRGGISDLAERVQAKSVGAVDLADTVPAASSESPRSAGRRKQKKPQQRSRQQLDKIIFQSAGEEKVHTSSTTDQIRAFSPTDQTHPCSPTDRTHRFSPTAPSAHSSGGRSEAEWMEDSDTAEQKKSKKGDEEASGRSQTEDDGDGEAGENRAERQILASEQETSAVTVATPSPLPERIMLQPITAFPAQSVTMTPGQVSTQVIYVPVYSPSMVPVASPLLGFQPVFHQSTAESSVTGSMFSTQTNSASQIKMKPGEQACLSVAQHFPVLSSKLATGTTVTGSTAGTSTPVVTPGFLSPAFPTSAIISGVTLPQVSQTLTASHKGNAGDSKKKSRKRRKGDKTLEKNPSTAPVVGFQPVLQILPAANSAEAQGYGSSRPLDVSERGTSGSVNLPRPTTHPGTDVQMQQTVKTEAEDTSPCGRYRPQGEISSASDGPESSATQPAQAPWLWQPVFPGTVAVTYMQQPSQKTVPNVAAPSGNKIKSKSKIPRLSQAFKLSGSASSDISKQKISMSASKPASETVSPPAAELERPASVNTQDADSSPARHVNPQQIKEFGDYVYNLADSKSNSQREQHQGSTSSSRPLTQTQPVLFTDAGVHSRTQHTAQQSSQHVVEKDLDGGMTSALNIRSSLSGDGQPSCRVFTGGGLNVKIVKNTPVSTTDGRRTSPMLSTKIPLNARSTTSSQGTASSRNQPALSARPGQPIKPLPVVSATRQADAPSLTSGQRSHQGPQAYSSSSVPRPGLGTGPKTLRIITSAAGFKDQPVFIAKGPAPTLPLVRSSTASRMSAATSIVLAPATALPSSRSITSTGQSLTTAQSSRMPSVLRMEPKGNAITAIVTRGRDSAEKFVYVNFPESQQHNSMIRTPVRYSDTFGKTENPKVQPFGKMPSKNKADTTKSTFVSSNQCMCASTVSAAGDHSKSFRQTGPDPKVHDNDPKPVDTHTGDAFGRLNPSSCKDNQTDKQSSGAGTSNSTSTPRDTKSPHTSQLSENQRDLKSPGGECVKPPLNQADMRSAGVVKAVLKKSPSSRNEKFLWAPRQPTGPAQADTEPSGNVVKPLDKKGSTRVVAEVPGSLAPYVGKESAGHCLQFLDSKSSGHCQHDDSGQRTTCPKIEPKTKPSLEPARPTSEPKSQHGLATVYPSAQPKPQHGPVTVYSSTERQTNLGPSDEQRSKSHLETIRPSAEPKPNPYLKPIPPSTGLESEHEAQLVYSKPRRTRRSVPPRYRKDESWVENLSDISDISMSDNEAMDLSDDDDWMPDKDQEEGSSENEEETLPVWFMSRDLTAKGRKKRWDRSRNKYAASAPLRGRSQLSYSPNQVSGASHFPSASQCGPFPPHLSSQTFSSNKSYYPAQPFGQTHSFYGARSSGQTQDSRFQSYGPKAGPPCYGPFKPPAYYQQYFQTQDSSSVPSSAATFQDSKSLQGGSQPPDRSSSRGKAENAYARGDKLDDNVVSDSKRDVTRDKKRDDTSGGRPSPDSSDEDGHDRRNADVSGHTRHNRANGDADLSAEKPLIGKNSRPSHNKSDPEHHTEETDSSESASSTTDQDSSGTENSTGDSKPLEPPRNAEARGASDLLSTKRTPRHKDSKSHQQDPLPTDTKFFFKAMDAELERVERRSRQRRRPRMQYTEEDLTCGECNKKFANIYRLKRHEGSHKDDRPFLCEICNKGFKQSGHRNEHRLTHEVNKRRNFLCNHCGVVIGSRSSFRYHLLAHQHFLRTLVTGNMRQQSSDVSNSADTDTTKTETSSTTETTESAPVTTMAPKELNSPTVYAAYDCPHCDNSFATAQSLNSHLETHMEVTVRCHVQPFTCDKCGRCFTYRHNLEKHKSLHNATKPEKYHDLYKRKVQEHIASGKPHYKCGQCGNVYLRKETLRKHEKVHTGIKPYRCDYCFKCFTQKIHLTVHLRLHTGSRPFQCRTCRKCFMDSTALARHMEKDRCREGTFGGARTDRRRRRRTNATQKAEGANGGEKKLLKCSQCPWKGKKTGNLFNHVARAHPDSVGKVDIAAPPTEEKECENEPTPYSRKTENKVDSVEKVANNINDTRETSSETAPASEPDIKEEKGVARLPSGGQGQIPEDQNETDDEEEGDFNPLSPIPPSAQLSGGRCRAERVERKPDEKEPEHYSSRVEKMKDCSDSSAKSESVQGRRHYSLRSAGTSNNDDVASDNDDVASDNDDVKSNNDAVVSERSQALKDNERETLSSEASLKLDRNEVLLIQDRSSPEDDPETLILRIVEDEGHQAMETEEDAGTTVSDRQNFVSPQTSQSSETATTSSRNTAAQNNSRISRCLKSIGIYDCGSEQTNFSSSSMVHESGDVTEPKISNHTDVTQTTTTSDSALVNASKTCDNINVTTPASSDSTDVIQSGTSDVVGMTATETSNISDAVASKIFDNLDVTARQTPESSDAPTSKTSDIVDILAPPMPADSVDSTVTSEQSGPESKRRPLQTKRKARNKNETKSAPSPKRRCLRGQKKAPRNAPRNF